jgi:hypothetical protein
MADTTPSASATAPAPFNLRQMQHLAHGTAFHRKSIDALSREQYMQLAAAMQTVEDAAMLCRRTSSGLEMLLDLLANSEIEKYVSEAMGGLLRPLAGELARTGQALRGSLD